MHRYTLENLKSSTKTVGKQLEKKNDSNNNQIVSDFEGNLVEIGVKYSKLPLRTLLKE